MESLGEKNWCKRCRYSTIVAGNLIGGNRKAQFFDVDIHNVLCTSCRELMEDDDCEEQGD